MDKLTCCKSPSWQPESDLGQAEGFDYLLGKCSHCGALWMNVFCVATGITGHEPVAVGDAERMRCAADGTELKELMRDWGRKNL